MNREHKTKIAVCVKCGQTKPIDDFYADRRTLNGKRSWCKDCCRSYSREYRRSHNERVKDIIGENGMVCRACGAVGDMDLHHVGPDKTEELSLMRSASDAEVEVEIKKTIPLCRSCHRALHMILARVTGSRRPLSASDTDLALRVLEYDQKMHDLGFKWCPKCRSYQADFPANSTRRDGLAGICRSCTSAYKADYRHKRKQAKERSK